MFKFYILYQISYIIYTSLYTYIIIYTYIQIYYALFALSFSGCLSMSVQPPSPSHAYPPSIHTFTPLILCSKYWSELCWSSCLSYLQVHVSCAATVFESIWSIPNSRYWRLIHPTVHETIWVIWFEDIWELRQVHSYSKYVQGNVLKKETQ